jgi:hypothetical protein
MVDRNRLEHRQVDRRCPTKYCSSQTGRQSENPSLPNFRYPYGYVPQPLDVKVTGKRAPSLIWQSLETIIEEETEK